MCTVLLPPGDNPLAVDKYIISYNVLCYAVFTNPVVCRSQWPRGLRRGSAVACLVEFQVWIPMRAWSPSVARVVYCQVAVSATGWSLVQRAPTECGVSECDLETSTRNRLWPNGAAKPLKNPNFILNIHKKLHFHFTNWTFRPTRGMRHDTRWEGNIGGGGWRGGQAAATPNGN